MDTNLKEGYKVKNFKGETKWYVQALSLQDNPELIAAYRRIHSKEGIWPEILQGIKDSGILEMDATMAKMGAGPRQAEWEEFVAQYQKAAPGQSSDEKWRMMERMFHLYDWLHINVSRSESGSDNQRQRLDGIKESIATVEIKMAVEPSCDWSEKSLMIIDKRETRVYARRE